MKVGLIGLPNSGKTTIFNLLTGHTLPTENYYTKGSEMHLGITKIVDKRLSHIFLLNPREQIKYAEINFVDMAGLMAEEAGRKPRSHAQFFANVRDVDALVYVIRGFTDPEIMQIFDTVDPKRDIETIELELIVSDLELVEKRLERISKELQAKKDKTSPETDVLKKCKEALEQEKPLRDLKFSYDEEKLIGGFSFISQKPVLILLNIGEEAIGKPLPEDIEEFCKTKNLKTIQLCGKVEEEISELSEEDQREFLTGMGIEEPGLPKFIKAVYSILKIVSFFTIGDKEVKAWIVPEGTNALDGAGKIHSDIQRGFIRAEVLAYEDLVREKTYKHAKEKGLVRLEGKEYIIKDGDIIQFRFSV